MVVSDCILRSTKILDATSISSRLDVEILLSNVLGKDRSWILAHPEHKLTSEQERTLGLLIARRKKHEPIAYILGRTEFYGREFFVDKNVLVPRPESEEIINQFLSLTIPTNAVIADVGCGSGALGITAKLEKPDIQLNLLDIDEHVFLSAKQNVRKHKIRAQYYIGDLLDAWRVKYDVLLCNLPYVPDNYPINKAASIEPKGAIFAGSDGLDLYRRLFNQLNSSEFGRPIVITESLLFQHDKLQRVAQDSGYSQINKQDLVQVFKSKL